MSHHHYCNYFSFKWCQFSSSTTLPASQYLGGWELRTTSDFNGMPSFPASTPYFLVLGDYSTLPLSSLFKQLKSLHLWCHFPFTYAEVSFILSFLHFKAMKGVGANTALKKYQRGHPNHGILLHPSGWPMHIIIVFHNYHPDGSPRTYPQFPQEPADPCIFRHIGQNVAEHLAWRHLLKGNCCEIYIRTIH